MSHIRTTSGVKRALSMRFPSRAVSLAVPNGHATSRHTDVWALTQEDAGGSASPHRLREAFPYGFVWLKAFLCLLYGKFYKIVCLPIPPPPFPLGRGNFLILFAGRLRPLHPVSEFNVLQIAVKFAEIISAPRGAHERFAGNHKICGNCFCIAWCN